MSTKKQLLKNQLKDNLMGKVDHVEYSGENNTQSSGVGLGLAGVQGNPSFVSQFDLNMTLNFSSIEIDSDTAVNGGNLLIVGNPINVLPDALPDALKVDIPCFIFGNSDFSSGFRRNKQLLPVSNWTFGAPQIVKEGKAFNHVIPIATTFGDDRNENIPSYSAINGRAQNGDLILPLFFQNTDIPVAPAYGTLTMCEVIVSCKQVGYGTLLAAISSDRFTINNIRYKIPNATKTAQFEKQLKLIKQSLFGKLATDDVSPSAFFNPNQFQDGTIDIPIEKGIDKESSIGTYLDYDVEEILWSIYVKVQDKLTQGI